MKAGSLLLLSGICAVAFGQNGPAITTEDDGSLRFTSGRNLVFETGDGGQVQFMTADGPMDTTGQKGEMGEMGDTGSKGDPGPQGPRGVTGDVGAMGGKGEEGEKGQKGELGNRGPQGPRGNTGEVGAMGDKGEKGDMGQKGEPAQGREGGTGGGLVTWNQCAWANLNMGQNFGQLVECPINKQQDDTWLRVTWNGNMRLTNCEVCCMRWFFSINGVECTEPGPVDAVIFMETDLHILRQSHISGVCRSAGGVNITSGPVLVQFSLMDCPGFGGFVYDAYTGWNSISRILLEEIIPRDTSYEELIAVEPPAEFTYTPHYCQYFFPNLGNRAERNLGTVIQVMFLKEHDFTALKLTWEGNLRQKSCTNCCAQWWFSVDGSRCTNFEDITTSIFSLQAVDMFVPTTLTGVCNQVGGVSIFSGYHNIKLEVGNCPGTLISNTASGFFSTSRVIVEEVPLARSPNVRNTTYHPNWEHCAIPAPIPEGTRDNGPLDTLSCGRDFTKTQPDSAIQVTFNGNMRLTACSDCCMRWFITINGEECVDPAPIDAVIYTVNGTQINIHRGSTITGICRGVGNGNIPMGSVEVKLNLGMCGGYNETFDSYTGLQSLSVIEVEEIPLPVLQPPSMPDAGFVPNWVQCTASDISSTVVNDTIMNCTFTKRDPDTVLKVAWDGNIAVEGCSDCCMRWYISINGSECEDPGPIDAAIRADLLESGTPQFDLRRPATISGICRGRSGGAKFAPGEHTFGLVVGSCPDQTASDVITGYNSISRFIIEELPDQNDDECTITLPLVTS